MHPPSASATDTALPTDSRWPTFEEARRILSEGQGRNVRIAILDSGIDLSHPALQGLVLEEDLAIKVLDGRILVKPGQGEDLFGHGTAIAWLIRQIAPQARLASIQVLDQNLKSRNDIIRAGVRAALDRGYHILNCSFGCRDADGRHIMKYKDWVDEAYVRGVHVVTACNNWDFLVPEWPGFFPTCVNVNMARAQDGTEFYYRPGSLVEFAAAGVGVRVPWVEGGYKEVSGSSYAAPLVSGYLARLLEGFPALGVPGAKVLLHRLARAWEASLAGDNARA